MRGINVFVGNIMLAVGLVSMWWFQTELNLNYDTIMTYFSWSSIDSLNAVSAASTGYHCIILAELRHVQVFAVSIVWVGDILDEFPGGIIPYLQRILGHPGPSQDLETLKLSTWLWYRTWCKWLRLTLPVLPGIRDMRRALGIHGFRYSIVHNCFKWRIIYSRTL